MQRALRQPWAWIALGVTLTLALRAPWLDSALGRDEGGVAYVAQSLGTHGAFAYGPYFIDRPPLLVGLYRIGEALGGDAGLRIIGALAAALIVVCSTLLAVRLAGRRAAPVAAFVSAALASSFALMAVVSNAELLAAAPSVASVLCLVVGLERHHRLQWPLIAAGALAGAAVLVKQSFGDALFAGVVALAAVALIERPPWRRWLARVGAYAAGIAAVAVALVAWAWVAHAPGASVWYALFGFRLDAASALAANHPRGHAMQLALPALGSGMVVAIPCALAGIASLRERRAVRLALFAWLAAGAVGVLLGGSYWPHYLIELVPVTAVGAAVAFARRPRPVGVAAGLATAVAVGVSAGGIALALPQHYDASAVAVGHYVQARATKGATVYVLYAHANVLHYANLPSPYPYHWSLMMRAAPHAERRLRTLLASPRRPTWIVRSQPYTAFGLDLNGRTQRLVASHYRPVATICSMEILLERGARARPAPPPASCSLAES
jgi:4-amino-4-deoxy-L-arabinose transferase-like glycosyltransferase